MVNPWPSGPPAVGRPVTNAVAPGAAELARALRPRLRGEVRIDPGVRALYSTDASNYRQLPIAVVTPRDAADVEATLEACSQRGLPVLSRGGGTSLAGQTCNTAVVLDFSRHMNQILQIDLEGRTATVEPGVVLDDLRDALTADGLTFGPDPATHNRCTLGGMIGNNSCGTHSLTTGRTADNVDALEVITYDGVRMWVGATDNGELDRLVTGPGIGQIYTGLVQLRDRNADLIRQRFPQIPRRVSGYNLDQLLPENHFNLARALVGTEGTCVVVLKAKLRLTSLPPVRRTVVIGFEDAAAAADAVPAVLELKPYGLEGFDDVLMRDVRKLGLHRDGWPLLPDGGGWLLVELGGESEQEVEEDARRLAAAYDSARALTPRQSQHVWGIRESGLGATARVPGEAPTWPGWEDSAVDPFVLGDYLRDLRRLYDRYGYHAALYGHYGQGCVHSRVDFDLASADGIATFRTFLDDAADVCVRYGGSLSGEHGDGQARAALLPKMYGPELVDAFGQFKALWDPESKMNPGKVVDPAAPVDNLRLGAHYRPRPLPTTFAFAADDGDFAKAVTRCVGVGACRSHSGTVMCPSYQVTREEEHSTRGRARLLFELLNGDELTEGWRDPHVRDALDLCLSCKGCKHDCPVDVDMAQYKAEFLSHWYTWRHPRPAAAYTLGRIMYGARLASLAPGLTNAVTHLPVLAPALKRAAGVHPDRDAPRFASTTFRRVWADRPPDHRQPAAPGGQPVLLWADTFTNYFRPGVGIAAVRVLEDAGCDVRLAGDHEAPLCCGRPLFDWGLLRQARRTLQRTLDAIGDQIDAGIPLVVLEPSCASVFRDELTELLPRDERAARLAKLTLTLPEFLEQRCPHWKAPTTRGAVMVQGHCHDRSVLDFDAELRLLARMGADVSVPSTGCCGMAGAFGFETAHRDLAVAIGEQLLLPAVRTAAESTAVVADGFSCHEQIRQETSRQPVHVAEVVAAALSERRTAGTPDEGETP